MIKQKASPLLFRIGRLLVIRGDLNTGHKRVSMVYSMLLVSLDCPFVIAHPVFLDVCVFFCRKLSLMSTKFICHLYGRNFIVSCGKLTHRWKF
jgi:hypothetical protein